MARGQLVQRNPYKGMPMRPWLRIQLLPRQGSPMTVDLIADTGSPFAIIIDPATMSLVEREAVPYQMTNFGLLKGCWVRFTVSELEVVEDALAYASAAVEGAVQKSCADFKGLVGLPLLRLFEYGGDAGSFWVGRPKKGGPTKTRRKA